MSMTLGTWMYSDQVVAIGPTPERPDGVPDRAAPAISPLMK